MTARLLLLLARLTSSPRFSPELEVTRMDVPIRGLPAALDGFTLAQISDLHVGLGAWGPVRAEEAARIVQVANPDVLVNTGDFLQGAPPTEKVVEVARRFLLRQGEGEARPSNLAVFGNHDYYAGDDAVRDLEDALRESGVTPLTNGLAKVTCNGAAVTFAGLTGQAPGFHETITELKRSLPPRVLLVHEADLAERLEQGIAELILAGHTHGGQIVLPGLAPLIVRHFNGSKFTEGVYHVNGNLVYINRGLGSTGLPFRFRAAPEVTFFRLTTLTD